MKRCNGYALKRHYALVLAFACSCHSVSSAPAALDDGAIHGALKADGGVDAGHAMRFWKFSDWHEYVLSSTTPDCKYRPVIPALPTDTMDCTVIDTTSFECDRWFVSLFGVQHTGVAEGAYALWQFEGTSRDLCDVRIKTTSVSGL